MTLDRPSLRRAIGARKLSDWVLTERHRDSLALAHGGTAWRSDRSDHLRVLVRRDLPSGRGTGVVEVQEQLGDAPALIGRAVALAEASLEPAWTTPPPAAPARVSLLDDAAADSLAPAAEALRGALLQSAERAGLSLVGWRVQVARDELALSSAQGFEVSWRQSEYQVSAVVNRGGEEAALRRTARRLEDLNLAAAMTALARELAHPQASLVRPPDKPLALQLSLDAMLGDDELGVWRALTALADARAQRRGLVRAPLKARAASPAPSSLIVWSDGALPYGTRSAPVGDEGEAVRRFKLFADGAVGEPGMGPRDAARAGRAPNGGVRNLVIAPGQAAGDTPLGLALTRGELPLLDVRRLRWLQLDPNSGRAEAELGLAFDQRGETAYAGGTFVLDLVPALAAAERAPQIVRRGSYQGPAWIRLGPVALR